MKYITNTVLSFGKYKGKTVSEISKLNPSYLLWCTENIEGFKLDENYKIILEELVKAEHSKWETERNISFEDYEVDFDTLDKEEKL
jgi:uncharacterized protein (DUF3820 family)